MTTPILTKKQQRQSLSAKKGPIKGLRNILAQPFENYWPVISVDQCPTLITLMNELLPLIRRPKIKIPKSMFKHMTKNERALAKKEALEKKTTKLDLNTLQSVLLGINMITRALERNNVCCILLDANIDPPFMIKHILMMAQNKKLPILLLPVLRIITLQTIGFATSALALKHNVMQSPDNAFYALYKLMVEVFKDLKLPKCSLQYLKSDEISTKSAVCKLKMTSMDCDSTSNMSKPVKPVTVLRDVYKYRSSWKERAFVPPIADKSSQVSQASMDEFIPLSDDFGSADDNYFTNTLKNKRYVNIHEKEESDNTEKDDIKLSITRSKLIDEINSSNSTGSHISKKRKNDDVTYLSLKVKRIQGNNNRLKATKSVKKKKKR